MSYFLTKKVKTNFLHSYCIPRQCLIQSIVQNVNTTIDLWDYFDFSPLLENKEFWNAVISFRI